MQSIFNIIIAEAKFVRSLLEKEFIFKPQLGLIVILTLTDCEAHVF